MDLDKLIARVKGILLAPKTEWPVIAAEATTEANLYKNYIAILALIPAMFGFIQMSLLGVSIPFAGTFRIGIGAGFTNLVLTYVLALVMVKVIAVVIDALAPSFGGQKDPTQALKVVAFAYTASWIASAAQIVPIVGALIGLAGGVYSVYLLYLGLPHTMKCPPDRAAGYTLVSVIIAIILSVIVGVAVASVTGVGSMLRGGPMVDGDVHFDEDSPLGTLEQWGRKIEEAGREMQAAQESGDSEAQANALAAMMGAALGGGRVEALAPDRLKGFLPETLQGMARTDLSVERTGAMGMQVSEAHATYVDDAGRSVRLEITDVGSAKALLALAGWAGAVGEKHSGEGFEKTYRAGGRLVHEKWDGTAGEYAVVLGDRFTVALKGPAASIDSLKAALGTVDLDGLEALKDEGVEAN